MTLRDYATRHGLTLTAARAQLAELALAQLEARARGGAQAQAARSPEERQAAARKAITARWARVRKTDSEPVRKDDSK